MSVYRDYKEELLRLSKVPFDGYHMDYQAWIRRTIREAQQRLGLTESQITALEYVDHYAPEKLIELERPLCTAIALAELIAGKPISKGDAYRMAKERIAECTS